MKKGHPLKRYDHLGQKTASFWIKPRALWFGWREGAPHFWRGDRDQGDLWMTDRPTDNNLQPTMKPLTLMERARENSSQPSDLVLDLFLGSGSTLIASERTAHVCYGVEVEPRYVDVAVMRCEEFIGEKA